MKQNSNAKCYLPRQIESKNYTKYASYSLGPPHARIKNSATNLIKLLYAYPSSNSKHVKKNYENNIFFGQLELGKYLVSKVVTCENSQLTWQSIVGQKQNKKIKIKGLNFLKCSVRTHALK